MGIPIKWQEKGHIMSGINKAIIIGRLGQDPELKGVGQTNVCTLSVATSESWTDNQGQKKERTEWHRVVVWGKLGENCAKYLNKGRQVYLEGRLQTRSWEDQQGQKRYTTEIVASAVQFLGGGQTSSKEDYGPEPDFDSNDEIPF